MKTTITLLLILFLQACTQENHLPLELSSGEIIYKVHKENIGSIAFMNDWIEMDKFTKNNFVKELHLDNDSDLAFRMFLDKTLTFYLNQLEPSLPVRELCDKGNFQITFLVDGKKLYSNRIPTGAGSCDYKNETTAYGIPLINKKSIDHWGMFLWVKFMKKGNGDNTLSGNKHALKIEVRPYIEHNELKIGEIIAQGSILLKRNEKQVDDSEVSIQAIQPTEKWNISKKKFNKGRIEQLNKKIIQHHFKEISSIVVIKDGDLLIEEYFNDSNRSSLHDTRSVGKTLTSTLMGIAIEEKYIKSKTQTLGEFYDLKNFKNYSSSKEKITLSSLLTMSSGIEGTDMESSSMGHEDKMYPTADWVKFTLDLPMDEHKSIGRNWDYFTAGVVLLGDILDKSLPNGLLDYADKKLFKPLGITDYKWQFTPNNTPNTAGGFQMSSLDYARWGQLYLDDGIFNNGQILPKQWVDDSMSKHLKLQNKDDEYYGFLFFNKHYKINKHVIDTYYAYGNGGNKIVIIKKLNAVIVITAKAFNQAYGNYQTDEILTDYLLPALIE